MSPRTIVRREHHEEVEIPAHTCFDHVVALDVTESRVAQANDREGKSKPGQFSLMALLAVLGIAPVVIAASMGAFGDDLRRVVNRFHTSQLETETNVTAASA